MRLLLAHNCQARAVLHIALRLSLRFVGCRVYCVFRLVSDTLHRTSFIQKFAQCEAEDFESFETKSQLDIPFE